ncbi:MAG: DUF1775 domain-containing protein [Pseudomonadota bacterium]
MKFLTLTACVAAAITLPGLAVAHATLEAKSAPMNANHKAIMRISHGCDGEATLSVTIEIPEGVINVKPMPKPGWKLTSVVEPYARTYEYYGPRSEGVTSITWTGELDDGHYDEFVFRGRITDAFEEDEVIYFPTTQLCANGEHAWVEIPAAGQERGDLDSPAPGLTVTADQHLHH